MLPVQEQIAHQGVEAGEGEDVDPENHGGGGVFASYDLALAAGPDGQALQAVKGDKTQQGHDIDVVLQELQGEVGPDNDVLAFFQLRQDVHEDVGHGGAPGQGEPAAAGLGRGQGETARAQMDQGQTEGKDQGQARHGCRKLRFDG